MKIRSLPTLLFTFLLLTTTIACRRNQQSSVRTRQDPTPVSTASPSPTPPDTLDHFLATVFDPLYDWETKAYLTTWKRVPGHQNFTVRQQVSGEVAGAYGLALIVTDQRLPTTQQFSLIIFIARHEKSSDLYWIFKNEELSQAQISRLSGDIWVSGQRGDGSKLNCEIAWSHEQNKWTCITF